MDLSAILLFTCAAAGTIMLAETLYFKSRRLTADLGSSAREPLLVNYARSFFPVILIVLIVRSFWFEPFRIPSASMMPNLVDGDFIFVTKYSYGLRLPFFNTKVLPMGEPHRGDVVVFRLPSDPDWKMAFLRGGDDNLRLTPESVFKFAFVSGPRTYSLNRFNYDDMASALLPRAVAYSAGAASGRRSEIITWRELNP
jgi:signal peptidase I